MIFSFLVKALVSTFLAMNEIEISVRTGGKEISMQMPKTQIQVIAGKTFWLHKNCIFFYVQWVLYNA